MSVRIEIAHRARSGYARSTMSQSTSSSTSALDARPRPASSRSGPAGMPRAGAMIQAFERRRRPPAAAGRRRARGRSAVERHVEPDRHAVALMTARFCGSTNVPPPVATTTCRAGSCSDQHRALDRRKYGSPCRAKISATGQPFARFDRARRCPRRASPRRRASARATVVLPAPMKPTRYILSVFTRTSRSSVSKNPGYEMATASAPSMVDGPSAASAAIAKAIAIR